MYEEQIQKITELSKRINTDYDALKVDTQIAELAELKEKQADPELYNDIEKMKKLNIEIKKRENTVEPWKKIKSDMDELMVLAEMGSEENDASLADEINNGILSADQRASELELVRMFADPEDELNCYLSIHSGAGGTESCDWAEMLFRMYSRWIEKKGFEYEVIEYQPGDEAGLKSVTLHVRGSYAYGFLQSETGVHRLVRISPFDANKKRHTSFVSIYTTAEIDDDIDVDIDPSDLRIDTFRSGGAGGQHVNTTDSAVRITHIPSGLVVSCQNERSQIQNRETAMKVLRSRLHEKMKQEREAALAEKAVAKKKIEWGSQIRSYVFHPYNMVKDHRTNFETGNVQAVMDGEITDFIKAWLKA